MGSRAQQVKVDEVHARLNADIASPRLALNACRRSVPAGQGEPEALWTDTDLKLS